MSITSELREAINELRVECKAEKEGYGYTWYTEPTRDRFSAIADAIDKAHDDELMKAKAVVLLDCISVADDFIELPKDADGKTIHLQDRMSWDNGTFDVHELNLAVGGWTTWDELHGYTVRADQCHHVQPDSWERIIEDATALGAQMKRRTHQIGDFVERCKRLAGEDA